MIYFNYESEVSLPLAEEKFSPWISAIISSENKSEGEISYIFCDDQYLLDINQQYLQHDTYTDIITFDYVVGNEINGDVFISLERVQENAAVYKVNYLEELLRVMSHGVLHLCGYKDKTDADVAIMRQKEDEKIKLFHVEHN